MRCFENLMRFNHAIIMLNECDLVLCVGEV